MSTKFAASLLVVVCAGFLAGCMQPISPVHVAKASQLCVENGGFHSIVVIGLGSSPVTTLKVTCQDGTSKEANYDEQYRLIQSTR